MATGQADFMEQTDIPSGKVMKIGIVVSDWNKEITGQLLKGCREVLVENEVEPDNIVVLRVPGSFELPGGARILLGRDKFDAIICLGCVIKGETKHDEYISQAVASGIMQLGLMMNMPIVFGVLTPANTEQAKERAGGKHGNKGAEAAVTALRMAELRKNQKSGKPTIGFIS